MKTHVNNLPDKTLVLVPHRLFSLWDMIQLHTKEFIKIWDNLDKATNLAFSKQDKSANPDEQKALLVLLTNLWNTCYAIQLRESASLCKEALSWIADPSYHAVTVPGELGKYKFPDQIPARPFVAVYSDLQGIRKKMYEELDSIRLAVVPPDRAGFFERDDLFGAEVRQACSAEINAEIKAAGNCLAADLNVQNLGCVRWLSHSSIPNLADRLVPVGPDNGNDHRLSHTVGLNRWP